jgi:putative membrane protein
MVHPNKNYDTFPVGICSSRKSLMDFIFEYYLWIKVVHVVSVVSWMAGLFYLPRLFVYHTEYPQNAKMLEIMEEKLFRIIMQPMMHLTILSGGMLLFMPGYMAMPWVHAKLTCVIFLIMFHLCLGSWKKQLRLGVCSKSSTFFRTINEIPTVLLILIVIFVIVRPF